MSTKHFLIFFVRPIITKALVMVFNWPTSSFISIKFWVSLKDSLEGFPADMRWSFSLIWRNKYIGAWININMTIIKPMKRSEDADLRWFNNCASVNIQLFDRLYLWSISRDLETQTKMANDKPREHVLAKTPITWKEKTSEP